jgi:U3 small nucleolar RNA-associated protein 7
VWKDALAAKSASPYMTHTLQNGALRDFSFCPYEDVLAVGHSGGLSTMLVPGAGEPNFDSYVADPFQGKKARREGEVRSLLEKLTPEMIVLDPTTIGQVC